jgi:hypothetical protein
MTMKRNREIFPAASERPARVSDHSKLQRNDEKVQIMRRVRAVSALLCLQHLREPLHRVKPHASFRL